MNRRESILAMIGGLFSALWPWKAKAAESAGTVIWANNARRSKLGFSCTIYRNIGTHEAPVWRVIDQEQA